MASSVWINFGSVQVGNGSAGAPSITFSSDATKGFYSGGTNEVALAIAGVKTHAWDATSYYILSNSAAIQLGVSQDVILTRIAAGAATLNSVLTLASATATPAGGSTAARLLLGTTASLGIYYGSGAPSVSASQGSIYIRSDGSSISTRLYVNTDGATTWTNFVSGA